MRWHKYPRRQFETAYCRTGSSRDILTDPLGCFKRIGSTKTETRGEGRLSPTNDASAVTTLNVGDESSIGGLRDLATDDRPAPRRER